MQVMEIKEPGPSSKTSVNKMRGALAAFQCTP